MPQCLGSIKAGASSRGEVRVLQCTPAAEKGVCKRSGISKAGNGTELALKHDQEAVVALRRNSCPAFWEQLGLLINHILWGPFSKSSDTKIEGGSGAPDTILKNRITSPRPSDIVFLG